MKTTTTVLGALALALGSTVLVVPAAGLAQDDSATGEAAPGATDGAGTGPGGMGPGGLFDFAAIDADKNGSITQDEIRAWRLAAIEGTDADGNGLVSEAELTAQIEKRLAARAAEMAARRIAAQDADGDGQLSVEELLAPAAPVALFERVDADGDGAITEAELEAMRTAMAERMDGRGHEKGGRGHGMGDHGGHGERGHGLRWMWGMGG